MAFSFPLKLDLGDVVQKFQNLGKINGIHLQDLSYNMLTMVSNVLEKC